MKRILGALVFTVCSIGTWHVHAQTMSRSTDSIRQVPVLIHPIKIKKPKPITHEWSAGVRLNTSGWSVFGEYGRLKAKNMKQIDMFHKVRFWQLEFTEKKSPREQKQSGIDNTSGGSTRYIYGKINNFYALKAGYGFKKLLVGKPETGTVSMHWVNAIGVALGMEKPYYLHVLSDPNAIKYSPSSDNSFLNQGVIVGSAGFSKGLGEMKFVPGGHFKSALHFDFSANRKNVLGVETGFNIEYYSSDIKLMANQPGTPYFLDIFVAIQFGKRW